MSIYKQTRPRGAAKAKKKAPPMVLDLLLEETTLAFFDRQVEQGKISRAHARKCLKIKTRELYIEYCRRNGYAFKVKRI